LIKSSQFIVVSKFSVLSCNNLFTRIKFLRRQSIFLHYEASRSTISGSYPLVQKTKSLYRYSVVLFTQRVSKLGKKQGHTDQEKPKSRKLQSSRTMKQKIEANGNCFRSTSM